MTAVKLRLVVDEKVARKSYDDYVGDYEWYVANEPESLNHEPGTEYGPGGPLTWETFLERWTESILGDVLGTHWSHTVEKADS